MYQQITIVGNVGADANIAYTQQGIAVASFSVAVSKVTGKGDAKREKTIWFRVTVWRERAETAAQYIKKGIKILVVGEVDLNTYTDKEGKEKSSLEITASDFTFLSSRAEMEERGGSDGGQPQGRGMDNDPNRKRHYTAPGDFPF